MRDADCVRFLQWSLPRLQMRWAGFRKVRRQVCKRIDRRMDTLGLSSLAAYREILEREPGEWDHLGALCRVTISRFYRDHGVFERLRREVLLELGDDVRCWSAGCASGEEPYTLAICARHYGGAAENGGVSENGGAFENGEGTESGRASEDRDRDGSSGDGLRILATDIDPHMLERARIGCYRRGTLKELPDDLIEAAFDVREAAEEPYCLREIYRRGITFVQHDLRDDPPDGPFDLILCRNLVFTYFDDELQRDRLERFAAVLRRRGVLVIGKHESLPKSEHFEPWYLHDGIYRRRS